LSRKSHELGAHLLVFPELALSGYPPEDLLLRKGFIDQVEINIEKIRNLLVQAWCWQQLRQD
jgi:predicted amidohydrolase